MSGGSPIIAAIDVCYHNGGATAAAVAFHDWADHQPMGSWHCWIPHVAEYEPGKFYRRELPCALEALKLLPASPSVIVVDGHVWLRPGEPGMGWHLNQATSIPVVGVAKTAFDHSDHASQVVRGASKRPLFVTAVGIDQNEAASLIHGMHGDFRIPTLLKLVDQLCRKAACPVDKTLSK